MIFPDLPSLIRTANSILQPITGAADAALKATQAAITTASQVGTQAIAGGVSAISQPVKTVIQASEQLKTPPPLLQASTPQAVPRLVLDSIPTTAQAVFRPTVASGATPLRPAVSQIVETKLNEAKVALTSPGQIAHPITGTAVDLPRPVADAYHTLEFFGFMDRGRNTDINDPLVNPWGKALSRAGQQTGLQLSYSDLMALNAPKAAAEGLVGDRIESTFGKDVRTAVGDFYRATDLDTPLGVTQEVSQSVSPGTILRAATVGKEVGKLAFTNVFRKWIATASKLAVPPPKTLVKQAQSIPAPTRMVQEALSQPSTTRQAAKAVPSFFEAAPRAVREALPTPTRFTAEVAETVPVKPQLVRTLDNVGISDIQRQIVRDMTAETRLAYQQGFQPLQKAFLGALDSADSALKRSIKQADELLSSAQKGLTKEADDAAQAARALEKGTSRSVTETVTAAAAEAQPKAGWYDKLMLTLNIGGLGAILGIGGLTALGYLGEQPTTPEDLYPDGISPELLSALLESYGTGDPQFGDFLPLPGGAGLYDPGQMAYAQMPPSVQTDMGPGGYVGLDSSGQPTCLYDQYGNYVRQLAPDERAILDDIIDQERPVTTKMVDWAMDNPVEAVVIATGLAGIAYLIYKRRNPLTKRTNQRKLPWMSKHR